MAKIFFDNRGKLNIEDCKIMGGNFRNFAGRPTDYDRRGGKRYFSVIIPDPDVAEQMKDEETTCVALLHDVVEDTDWTLDELREQGFDARIIEALKLMTHAEGVPYMEYVTQIKPNPIAKVVKLADLRHNSDLTRLNEVNEKALARVEKYKKAIAMLEEVK